MTQANNFETLFTEREPSLFGYRKQAEAEFRYLNSHADPPVIAARQLMESWYEQFPIDHRRALASRFRSSNQKQHEGAFWELYLHQLFLRMGYSVLVHPEVSGSEAHPDFLLLKNDVPVAFVEGRLAGLPSDGVSAAKRLECELHDALNEVRSPNFFLRVKETRTGPRRPSFKRLIKDIESWLETLNPDLPIDDFLHAGRAEMRFEWEHGDWFLALQVIPKSPEHRGNTQGPSVGMFATEVGWLDTRGELKRALGDKANKYGTLNLPFLIAVNHMGIHCDRTDWTDVLYGTQAVNITFAEDGSYIQDPFRKNDGFWIRYGLPRQTHVSAVIAGWAISPWSMGAHSLEAYAHFAPTYPIDLGNNLPWWHVPPGRDELVMREGRSSAEILGIPAQWPPKWRLNGG